MVHPDNNILFRWLSVLGTNFQEESFREENLPDDKVHGDTEERLQGSTSANTQKA